MERVSCNQKDCKECMFLKEGFAIDHVTLKARKTSGVWWGTDLVSWWYPHFLVPPFELLDLSANDIAKTERTIRMHLSKCTEDAVGVHEGITSCAKQTFPLDKHEDHFAEWLWDMDESDGEKSGNSGNCFSGLHVDDNLPEALVVQHDPRHLEELSTAMDPVYSGVYCKLVVTCHLLGVNHAGFIEAVTELARRSIYNRGKNEIRSCSEFRSLLELSSQLRLDISSVLNYHGELVVQRERQCLVFAKPICPEAQKEAVRDGYKFWGGTVKRAKLRRSYDVLDGLSSDIMVLVSLF